MTFFCAMYTLSYYKCNHSGYSSIEYNMQKALQNKIKKFKNLQNVSTVRQVSFKYLINKIIYSKHLDAQLMCVSSETTPKLEKFRQQYICLRATVLPKIAIALLRRARSVLIYVYALV